MGEIGKRYKKDNITATVVEENEKFKTCILQLDDGKTINLTTKTLHDVWVLVDTN